MKMGIGDAFPRFHEDKIIQGFWRIFHKKRLVKNIVLIWSFKKFINYELRQEQPVCSKIGCHNRYKLR